MKAKRNRYDLSLWDVRKLSLYGRAAESVQGAALFAAGVAVLEQILASLCPAVLIPSNRMPLPGTDSWPGQLYLNQDGIKRGRVAHARKFF